MSDVPTMELMAPPIIKPTTARRMMVRERFTTFFLRNGHMSPVYTTPVHMTSFLRGLSVPAIVGVINVTPDSFVESSRRKDADSAAAAAVRMASEGADIVEIGGESTGPGSADIAAEEELSRVVPAVAAIRAALPFMPICIDTYRSTVAEAALRAGADMINDVTAGRGDSRLFAVLAEAGCPVVLMYAKDPTARTSIADFAYEDVIHSVKTFLHSRIEAAASAGIDSKQIIVDPGLGHFVSSISTYSYEILDRLSELTDLGPILVSPSRKSFLAGTPPLPVEDRLHATLAAVCLAAVRGASFIRTHDTEATKRVLESIAGMRN